MPQSLNFPSFLTFCSIEWSIPAYSLFTMFILYAMQIIIILLMTNIGIVNSYDLLNMQLQNKCIYYLWRFIPVHTACYCCQNTCTSWLTTCKLTLNTFGILFNVSHIISHFRRQNLQGQKLLRKL